MTDSSALMAIFTVAGLIYGAAVGLAVLSVVMTYSTKHPRNPEG